MGTNTSAGSQLRETRAVLDAIRRIVQALRESSRSAERLAGLTGAQAFVLHRLAQAAPVSVDGFAAATRTHQRSVSAVVAALADRGLVRRAKTAEDARRMELTLTAEGRSLVARVPDVAQQRLIAAIDELPPARRHALASTLTALASAVAPVDGIPPMFFEERAPRGRRRRPRV